MRLQKQRPAPPQELGGLSRDTDSRHRFSKRLLQPIAALFKTGDDTDTVDRLFASKHVNDLRLIAAMAFIALGIVCVIALLSALGVWRWDWDTAQGATPHQVTAQRIAAAAGTFVKILGPTMALFGVILAWAYQKGSQRLGVVDLFACEIDTLCRVITVIDTVSQLVENVPLPRHFNSEENYFPILEGNSSDLQNLEASVVVNITAFYTYMKTVRDKLRAGESVKSGPQRETYLKDLVYMLYLGLECGRKATRDLVEFEPACTERTMVVLLSELSAYHFLRQRYRDQDDLHNHRLMLRGPAYVRLINELDLALSPHRETLSNVVTTSVIERLSNEYAEWSRALLLWPELEARYDKLVDEFPLTCTVERGRLVASDPGLAQQERRTDCSPAAAATG